METTVFTSFEKTKISFGYFYLVQGKEEGRQNSLAFDSNERKMIQNSNTTQRKNPPF